MPGATFTYSQENMLETATVGPVTTTYRYDGDQARTLKIQGSKVGYFTHDAKGQLLSEFEEPCPAAFLPVRDYVYMGTRLLAAIRPSAPQVALGFEAPASSVPEAGTATGRVSFTSSSGSFPCAVSVNYASTNGTAVAPADYSVVPGTFTIVAGTPSPTTSDIPASIVPDTMDEDDENFTLILSSASGGVLGQSTHVMTILDNDPPPSLSIGDVTVTEGDVDTTATFTVTLSAPSGKTVTVNYATADGTAVAGTEYVATSGVLTFTPVVTSQAVDVVIRGDLSDEATQTFFVNLSGAVNATISDAQAQGTILDNDPPPTISIPDSAVIEGTASGRPGRWDFLVWLSAPSDFNVQVAYTTTNITTSSTDHDISPAGILTFPPGTPGGTIGGGVWRDDISEPNETLRVDLSNAVNATIGDGQATGTILDDEAMSYYTITPCRLVSSVGGTPLAAGSTRVFPGTGQCGLPATAKAIAVTVTAVNPSTFGYLLVYPAFIDEPSASTINFNPGVTRSSNATVTLGGGGQLAVLCMASGTTDVIIDVFGYFE